MSTHRDPGEHGPLIVAGVGSAVLSFVGPDGDAVLVYSCSAVSCVSGR